MADENTKTASPAVVTEEDLLKSIKALESKGDEDEKKKEAEPAVKVTELEKTAAESLKERASESLTKALDVSDALTEIVGLLGSHVDESLGALAKSVQGSAERDLAFVKVIVDLKKSIDDLTAKVEAYGDAPTPAKSTLNNGQTGILQKGANQQEQKTNPDLLRKQISDGLESLAKNAEMGSPAANRYISAAIKFESTGELDEITMREVQKLYKQAS